MSITPMEREIERASEAAFNAQQIRVGRIEAPTGGTPRAWTQAERNACQETMRRIVESERASCR